MDKMNSNMLKNRTLEVREMIQKDSEYFVDYWQNSTPQFLTSMGVDITKRPTKQQLLDLTSSQLAVPLNKKKTYFLTWLNQSIPIGCSNLNQIIFGESAYMHIHLYQQNDRQKGLGTEFIVKSIPYYFENLKLKVLYCEPYALNPAPNKTLEKIGFKFVKQYETIPGASNFEQLVNLWKMTRQKYEQISTQNSKL